MNVLLLLACSAAVAAAASASLRAAADPLAENAPTTRPQAPTRLRTAHAQSPVRGITTPPLLSFALGHRGHGVPWRRGVRAASYELQVAAVPSAAVVWACNTTARPPFVLGSVPGCAALEHPGLLADHDYAWCARWWATDATLPGPSDWSSPAAFSTGLLRETDWLGAAWLSMDGPPTTLDRENAPFADPDQKSRFRTTFSVKNEQNEKLQPTRCSLMIAGLGCSD